MNDPDLLSSGAVARRLGLSLSGLRKLERRGAVPPSLRMAGLGRTWRVWPAADLAEIERAVEQYRGNGRRTAPATERAATPA